MSIVKEASKRLFKKPSTLRYPFEKTPVPSGLRGAPVLDKGKCILCILCQNICPTGAIKLTQKGPDAGIAFLMDRCIFCGECADICPKKAITMSDKFELAGSDRSKMVNTYRKAPLCVSSDQFCVVKDKN